MSNWKKYLIGIATALLLFGGGYYAGRSSKPAEKTTTQVVKVDQTSQSHNDTHVEDKSKGTKQAEKQKQNNIVIHKTTTKKPDGTVVTDEWKWDASNSQFKLKLDVDTSNTLDSHTDTKVETKVETKTVIVEKRDGPFHAGVGIGYDVLHLDLTNPEVNVHASYKVLGPVNVFVEGSAPIKSAVKDAEVKVGFSGEF